MIILRQKMYAAEMSDEELEYRMKKKKERIRKQRLKNVAIGVGSAAAITGGVLWGKNKYGEYLKTQKKPTKSYANIKAEVGDIVSATRHGGLYSHYGVVTGKDGNGRPIITNYTNPTALDPRKSRVIKSSLQEFGEGGDIRVEKPNGRFTPDQIVQRANGMMGDKFGHYSITRNNCEHFAREVANGEHTSTQVTAPINKFKEKAKNSALGLVSSIREKFKQFSNTAPEQQQKDAISLMKGQAQHLIANNGFNIRKNLSKDLGGLSHFNRYQDAYITAGGSALGGLIGRMRAKRKAEREAKLSYGLRKGTLEYDNYVNQKKKEGMLKGAAIGTGLGFASSKGVDTIRGKVISDKARVGHDLDLGTNYTALGKSLRGVRSEDDIEKVKRNYKEIADFGKGIIDSL